MKALLVCVSSLFLSSVLGELDISVGSNTRHEKKNNGAYRTKEEVERPPVADHPCNLTRTAVKISFPAMKEAVFVNFLGYREPNLQYVMRCKGVCGNQGTESLNSQACVPTRVGQKVVNMMIKSQRQGRDEREAWQEVELEEHLACGCGCEPGAAEACATQSMFNPATCECECTELIWGPERETCLERSGYYWDERTCSCRNRHKKISPRHVGDSPRDCGFPSFTPSSMVSLGLLDVVSYIVLGSSATLALFLFLTTWYYRRKYKKLLRQEKSTEKKNKYKKGDKHEDSKRRGAEDNGWTRPHRSYSSSSGARGERGVSAGSAAHCNGFISRSGYSDMRSATRSYQAATGK